MLLWLVGLLALTWLVGGALFVGLFCGFDWEEACRQRYEIGWAVIVLTISASLVLAWRLRNRCVMTMALLSVPLQVWFYTAYAIPTASLTPN